MMYPATTAAINQKPNSGSRATGPPRPAASAPTGIHQRYRMPNTTASTATTTHSRRLQERNIETPSSHRRDQFEGAHGTEPIQGGMTYARAIATFRPTTTGRTHWRSPA